MNQFIWNTDFFLSHRKVVKKTKRKNFDGSHFVYQFFLYSVMGVPDTQTN